MKTQKKMESRFRALLDNAIVLDRRYLDDEQLDRKEQFQVLQEIFNENVRDREIKEISSHFAPVFRQDHPVHLSLLGKTGTGKTVTTLYFLNTLSRICRKKGIEFWYDHLDLPTPKPCFRALNDLACILNASKRYKKGISLDEMMGRIEDRLKDYKGYFVLFIDEIDNVRTDFDTFLKFLVKRLPQRISAKLVLVFASNRLSWRDNIDPRIRSFLKINELIFDPYNAHDLLKILRIRVKKALDSRKIDNGVLKKIAAVSSRNHGDARKAVELLTKSAYLAEKGDGRISLDIVDEAYDEIERDKYVALVKSSPKQLQAVVYAVLEGVGPSHENISTGEGYEVYKDFCEGVRMRALTQRAFSELVAELDVYGFLNARIVSKGRYGRTREISLAVPDDVVGKLKETIELGFDMKGNG